MKKILSIVLLATSIAVSAKAVIVGASVGYLTDAEEGYFAARIGTVFSKTDTLTNIAEFEIGYTDQSNSSVGSNFMPVTVNYRGEFSGKGAIGTYFGLGAGMARTHVDLKGYGITAQNWSFVTQGFAGLIYKVTDKAYLNLGARYIWIDDVKLLGSSIEIGDDIAVECGFHFKF